MIVFLVSLVAVLGFVLALYRSGILDVTHRIIGRAYDGVAAILDHALTDNQKEAAIRKAGLALIGGAWQIAWRIAICLAAAVAPVYIAQALGYAEADAVFALMLRLDYIIGLSMVPIILIWARRRQTTQTAPKTASASHYGKADRLLHMLAFSGPGLQKLLNRVENILYARRLGTIPQRPPVFVTSLARGGTSAVLNALNDLPELVSHTYRDMPFLTAPLLWGRLGASAKRTVKRQRAHGDGLTIDLDSPEAFDEVYWKLFWPKKYKRNRIALWTIADHKTKASQFFEQTFRKIRLVRGAVTARYVSKNNANIARLGLLPRLFKNCDIIIPLRRPATHAASLLRQHKNFLKRHAEDDFTRRYMRDIGHLEFGQLHTPIAFDGFDAKAQDPLCPDYWLSYWIAAFTEVRKHMAACHILAQDDLRSAPVPTMQALCRLLQIDASRVDFSIYFRAEPDITDRAVFDPALLEQAENLYAQLAKAAIR